MTTELIVNKPEKSERQRIVIENGRHNIEDTSITVRDYPTETTVCYDSQFQGFVSGEDVKVNQDGIILNNNEQEIKFLPLPVPHPTSEATLVTVRRINYLAPISD